LPKNAADVFSVRAGLAAEAWSVGGELYRQPVTVYDVIAGDVRNRNFGGWNKVIVGIAQFKEIFLEFWKLACAEKAFGISHEGRHDLLIAVFLCVDIQHEIDQRTFHACSGSCEQRKPGTGNLGGTLQVHDSQRRAQIPVGFRLKVELRRTAHSTDLHVL